MLLSFNLLETSLLELIVSSWEKCTNVHEIVYGI